MSNLISLPKIKIIFLALMLAYIAVSTHMSLVASIVIVIFSLLFKIDSRIFACISAISLAATFVLLAIGFPASSETWVTHSFYFMTVAIFLQAIDLFGDKNANKK